MDVELEEWSINVSIVKEHQQSASAKKGIFNEIGWSSSGKRTQIHTTVDAYGYSANLLFSEGQKVKWSMIFLYGKVS